MDKIVQFACDQLVGVLRASMDDHRHLVPLACRRVDVISARLAPAALVEHVVVDVVERVHVDRPRVGHADPIGRSIVIGSIS